MDEQEKAAQPRRQKTPRKLTAPYLENAALHYLKRFAATEAGLRRVLMRKVERSLRAQAGEGAADGVDRAQAQVWIDELVQKLVRNGLVNDASFAEQKAQSLRASGRSARVIALKLRMKGVPDPLAAQQLGEVVAEVPEEDAARTWAKKKRLGPFRKDVDRRAQRQRDLAAMVRAGFPFDIARRVIDADADADADVDVDLDEG